MKLVFYSGGHDSDNVSLDQNALHLLQKKNPVLTYIPTSSYLSEVEFNSFVKKFSRHKINRFIHFPVDVPFDDILLQEVLKSDLIHLGGGNTFYFLNYLRKTAMISRLRNFVKNGGVLTGLSAGAIMMCETIEMAGYPEFDCDENSVNIKNLSSLSLVDFHFFPHFRNSPRYDKAFRSYTKRKDIQIYACPDGSGLVVKGSEMRFIGRCYVFSQGRKIVIN
jgi:dipeptidase E